MSKSQVQPAFSSHFAGSEGKVVALSAPKSANSTGITLDEAGILNKEYEIVSARKAGGDPAIGGLQARAVAAEGVWLHSPEPAATGSRRTYRKGSYGNRHGEMVQ